MIQRYRSFYPNHVHLLTIAASKHLYLLADRTIKYQAKPIENTLSEIASSKKNALVHFVLADHTSGAVYGESVSCREVLNPCDFLYCAWRKKSHTYFCGVPELLSLPKAVDDLWPEVREYAKANQVIVVPPENGFKGGVVHYSFWEKEVTKWGVHTGASAHTDLKKLSEHCQQTCNERPEKFRGATCKQHWHVDVPDRPLARFPMARAT